MPTGGVECTEYKKRWCDSPAWALCEMLCCSRGSPTKDLGVDVIPPVVSPAPATEAEAVATKDDKDENDNDWDEISDDAAETVQSPLPSKRGLEERMRRFTVDAGDASQIRTSRMSTRARASISARASIAALSGMLASTKAAFTQKSTDADGEPKPRISIATIARVKMQFAKKVCNWRSEAERLENDYPFVYGHLASDQSYHEYALVGHYSVLWCRATAEERLAVIEAFQSNAMVKKVEMFNALITDEEAQAWGRVLASNQTLTSLNLETNAISSGGVLALADGLKANSSLRELKLANQSPRTVCTQQVPSHRPARSRHARSRPAVSHPATPLCPICISPQPNSSLSPCLATGGGYTRGRHRSEPDFDADLAGRALHFRPRDH